MNLTAGANSEESVTFSYPQITTEHLERSQQDSECSRDLAAQTVIQDITETLGTTFVPDLFAALHTKPGFLDVAWDLFKHDVGLLALDPRTKRIVALAITTNKHGAYQIVAVPRAFRLSPVGPRRCDTIVSLIRIIQAFDRYLADMMPLHTLTTTRLEVPLAPTPHPIRPPE